MADTSRSFELAADEERSAGRSRLGKNIEETFMFEHREYYAKESMLAGDTAQLAQLAQLEKPTGDKDGFVGVLKQSFCMPQNKSAEEETNIPVCHHEHEWLCKRQRRRR